MTRLEATIQNENGIHCRPTAVIIKAIGDYPGRIDIINENGRSDPRSMLGLMSLCLTKGNHIAIEVEGPDEHTLAAKLKELFETHFDFPPRESGGLYPFADTPVQP